MLNKLLFASVIAFGFTPPLVADARSPMPLRQSRTIFAIDHRLKAEGVSLPEYHFELHADGTWSFLKTMKQSIQKQASGKLSARQTQRIKQLLESSAWTVTQDQVACMAFAAVNTVYSVDGVSVWTDEMCSGQHLDKASSKRLAQVMKIVDALIAAA